MPGMCEGKVEDAGLRTGGEEQQRAIELNNDKRAVVLWSRYYPHWFLPSVMHVGFSHFAVAGYPVTVVKVQEQIKVK